jgi:hypothetical protein
MLMENTNQASCPEKVGTAVKLLYATLGIGVLRSIMEASRHAQKASLGFVIFVSVFVLGITCLFIYKIGRGRNWARITFLVLFIIGLPFSILPLLKSLAANPVSGLLGIAQIAIQLIALVFLFQKTSSYWFKEMKLGTDLSNRVRGSFSLPLPTPPGMRVRTGRFVEVTGP